MAHGKLGLCRASAAVGGSPSATDGENFAVCLLSLCRVLGAHGELANSGSVRLVYDHAAGDYRNTPGV